MAVVGENGDKTDKTLVTQYFMSNFTYHDSVFGVTSYM